MLTVLATNSFTACTTSGGKCSIGVTCNSRPFRSANVDARIELALLVGERADQLWRAVAEIIYALDGLGQPAEQIAGFFEFRPFLFRFLLGLCFRTQGLKLGNLLVDLVQIHKDTP